MPREKKIPDKPRFDFVTQTAYKFLLECGYTRFPISPYDVLDEEKKYKRVFKTDYLPSGKYDKLVIRNRLLRET